MDTHYTREDLEGLIKAAKDYVPQEPKIIPFESKKFNKIFSIVKEYDSIDSEDLLYETVKIPKLNENIFVQFCESVFTNLSDKVKDDKNFPISVQHVTYKGIKFSVYGPAGQYTTHKI